MFKAKYYPYSHKNFLLKSASSQENRDCFLFLLLMKSASLIVCTNRSHCKTFFAIVTIKISTVFRIET